MCPTDLARDFDRAGEGYKATRGCKYSAVHFILKPRNTRNWCVFSGALE
jgi:hypothetical protein